MRLRRRPAVLGLLLAAAVGCGAFGWFWLSGLADVRRLENEPVRRHALGNILPDIEGQAGAVKAFLWPVAATGLIGGVALVGWAVARRSATGGRPPEGEGMS